MPNKIILYALHNQYNCELQVIFPNYIYDLLKITLVYNYQFLKAIYCIQKKFQSSY